jgi:type II secretory pathway pseudopilin PulG
MCRERGLTLMEVLIIVAIVLVICAIAIPGLLSSQRASNERDASTTLKTLSSAEADFRANDRDGNRVNDFWTADAKGLYTLLGPEPTTTPGATTKEVPVMLIHQSVAAADADGNQIAAGGKNTPLSAYAAPAHKAGYWYAALHRDNTLKGEEAVYRQDTAGTPSMGKVHNTSKFGFMAFPDAWSQGKFVFIVNENNTIFRREMTAPARRGTAVPPGLGGVDPVHLNWPEDQQLTPRKWSDD